MEYSAHPEGKVEHYQDINFISVDERLLRDNMRLLSSFIKKTKQMYKMIDNSSFNNDEVETVVNNFAHDLHDMLGNYQQTLKELGK